ncbi:hypothetical protein ESCO_006588 [Escovopsis weberi]|uniref:Life-span regulatory factor domain-containing protein n=1 Tax=Escovopsis weberi TaxID=150374 RepID=A0A0M9VXQ2_ESCWE|nr:hypothetical protein ESCO_006588 [Escovopsis weberi]
MALDLWTHQFCLACDRQVQVDDDAYCSEACRMADFEKTDSAPSSQSSSHGYLSDYGRWSGKAAPSSPRPSPAKFYLSPAYDFHNPRPYGIASRPESPVSDYHHPHHMQASQRTHSLSPSSSHSSLCSMQSSTSSTASEPGQLSDKARMELRAYAVSFEQVRLQRRRSNH